MFSGFVCFDGVVCISSNSWFD